MRYAKIWKKVLGEGESIEHEFSLSHFYVNLKLCVWTVISIATVWIYGIGFIIFAIALFYYGYYLYESNAYAFTNKRVLIHRGWLSTSIQSVDFSRITDVDASEHFIDKHFFDIGKLMINTAGTGIHEIQLTHVANPYGLKKKLTDLMDADEKNSRGIY